MCKVAATKLSAPLIQVVLFQAVMFLMIACGFIVQAESSARAAETVLDMVLAVVDDEPVTASEVRRFLVAQGRGDIAATLDTHSPEVRKAVQEVVTEKLLRKEAEEAGIKVSGEEIQTYIKEIKAQNQVDDAGFEALLSQQGLSFDDYKRQVESDILRARVISARVKSRVNVVDEDIAKAAAPAKTESSETAVAEAGESTGPQEVDKLEGLLIRFDAAGDSAIGRSKEQAKTVAEELAEKSRGSKALQGLDKEMHIDFGAYKPQDLKEELQEPAKALGRDEVSSVIETDGGYYILRRFVTESDAPAPQVVDDSTKDKLRKELLEARFRERLDKFLNEELPAKYHVDIKI